MDEGLKNQIQESDKVETFGIFDAIVFGMKVSVDQHKLKETGAKNDGHN